MGVGPRERTTVLKNGMKRERRSRRLTLPTMARVNFPLVGDLAEDNIDRIEEQ
jgi:hypothetical protein